MENFEVYYDGECPICVKEIRFLQWIDSSGEVDFIDISEPGFNGAHGKSYDTLMGRMHARTPEGEWIDGVDVFEQLYAAVGLGFVSFVLRIPGVRSLAQYGYDWFAENRLELTGRCDTENCQVH